MKTSLAFAALTLAVGLATAIVPAEARRRAEPATANAGQFDYFLLSLSIAPDFCALSPANAAKDECRTLTEADFEQTPLTVHGLWPNIANVSVNRQPQDCGGPPLEGFPAPVAAQLRRYMPGGPQLAAYEWRKHGTCTGLSAETYFTDIAHLAQLADGIIGTAMRENGLLGHSVRIADLLADVNAKAPALAPAIIVNCRSPRGGGPALIDEIRIVLSKDFQPIPAANMGLGQNSGCPQGAGFVRKVGGSE